MTSPSISYSRATGNRVHNSARKKTGPKPTGHALESVGIRLSRAELLQVEALARRKFTSRSAVIRAAVQLALRLESEG